MNIKIQKLSNGQFCTAKEFALDFVAREKSLIFPKINTNIQTAEDTLNKMIAEKGEYLSIIKICLACNLLNQNNTSYRTPEIRNYFCICNGKIEAYFKAKINPWNYEEIEKSVDDVIEEQKSIVENYNKMEVEI